MTPINYPKYNLYICVRDLFQNRVAYGTYQVLTYTQCLTCTHQSTLYQKYLTVKFCNQDQLKVNLIANLFLN